MEISPYTPDGPGSNEQVVIPHYYRVIDECLSQKESLLESLETACRESRSLQKENRLSALMQALQEGKRADDFVNSATLAPFLPIILMHGSQPRTSGNIGNWVQWFFLSGRQRSTRSLLLSYPVILLVLYGMALSILSFTVIPQFRSMYEEFELKLPVSTTRLLWLSGQISEHPLRSFFVALLLILSVLGVIVLARRMVYAMQSVPMLAMFFRSSKAQYLSMISLIQTLVELLRIGAPLEDAIRIAGLASGNSYYRSESSWAANKMMEVSSRNMDTNRWPACFPSSVAFALQAGPDRTPSIALLQQLADIYLERLQQRTVFARGVVGPAMTLIFAWLIGGILRDLMMPLISLITTLSGS